MNPDGRTPTNAFGRLAGACARHWKAIVAAWILAVVLLAAPAAHLRDTLRPGGFEIAGSSSDNARTRIQELLPGRDATSLVAVIDGGTTADRVDTAGRVRAALSAPALADLVARVTTAEEAPALRRPERGLELVSVGLRKGIDEALKGLDPLVTAAEAAARPGVTVRVTGGPAAFRDWNRVSEHDLRVAEAIQVPFVALILLLVLGTVVASVIPIVLAAIALVATLGGLYFVARGVDLSIYVANVVPLVGIGVAVDYALFVVGRFREELAAGWTPVEAAARTGASAGRAIFFSGLTVALALSGMLAVGVPVFTGFAVGTMAVVAVAVAAALTLVPAVLGALGHRIDRAPVGAALRARLLAPFRRRRRSESAWERWAETVMRRPWPFALGAVALMLALAVPVVDMRLGSSGLSSLPEDVPSRQGSTRLASVLGNGFATPHTLLLTARAPAVVPEAGVALLLPRIRADREFLTFAPDGPAGSLRAADGRAQAIVIVGRHDDDSREAQAFVGRLEAAARAEPTLAGVEVAVGGASSQNRDFTSTVRGNLPWVMALVMALTFAVLVAVFRSLLLPLKAVVMTLVSSLAAYGVLVMVFQYGWADRLLGFEHLGHVTSWVPPFLFSILFGLSMDYEVFLLSRVREHRDRGADDRAAVAWGLARTGGIITAAAAIMVVVFASFLTNRLIPIKEASLGLGVAILLDATLVRIVLVPAFMRIAGRWNWWLPAWLDRLLPRLPEEPGEALASAGSRPAG